MSRSRDPLALGPHWHADCRLEAELPEDNVVGRRFLVNALIGSVTFGLLLVAGWTAYFTHNLRAQIRDWDQRIRENRAQVHDVQLMQVDYVNEARKIDQAYAALKSPLYLTGFLADLSRALPVEMTIDSIESTDAGILVHGSIAKPGESVDPARDLFNGYLARLQADTDIAPYFDKIRPNDFARAGRTIAFEILFQRKAPATP